MATEMAKPAEAGAALNELLQFEIDKTHESLSETGKSLGTAFLTYLSLVALTAVLIYGRVEDNVELPLLSLKVNKELAAAITVVLCQLVQLWLISLIVLHSSLSDLLSDQLKERFDRASLEMWYLQYPSPFHSVRFFIERMPGHQSTFITAVLSVLYSTIVAFVPVFLSYAIYYKANFPEQLRQPWLIVNTILNLAVMNGMIGAFVQLNRSAKRVRSRTRLLSDLTSLDSRAAALEVQMRDREDVFEEKMRDYEKIRDEIREQMQKVQDMTAAKLSESGESAPGNEARTESD